MSKCFIIQPFSEKYQKLYKDVYKPAIEEAGIEPYKVDDDPSVNVPIESIAQQIRNSSFCFAEISEDNPNVWYELGYAISSGLGFCIVCSKQKRDELPFDVRHLNVLFYDADAPSDFLNLQKQIVSRLKSLEQETTVVERIQNSSVQIEENAELAKHDIVALALIAAQQVEVSGSTSIYSIKHSIVKAGYTELAFALSFNKFESTKMVETFDEHDFDSQEGYRACRLTELGWTTIRQYEDTLNLEIRSPKGFNDEIPF